MFAEQARKYVPEKKTYAIRLFGTDRSKYASYGELQDSKNYLAIKKYVFDDIEYTPEQEEGCGEDYLAINDSIAREIITDFKPYRNSIDELLVHCWAGLSRSPAVAKALNDIFKLGNSDSEFSEYNQMNMFVYNFLMNNKDAAR